MVRAVDYEIAPGVWPDMTKQGLEAGGCIVTGNEDGIKHCGMGFFNPPTGFGFHSSCKYSFEKCEKIEPELKELEAGHLTSCHLYN